MSELKDLGLNLRVVGVDELTPGPEMDILVAQYIMGWPKWLIEKRGEIPNYSGNEIAEVITEIAFEEREKLIIQIGDFCRSTIECYVCIQTQDDIIIEERARCWSELSAAICRAALKMRIIRRERTNR